MKVTQNVSFGQRLRRERESHHWTQKQLARKISGDESAVPSINRWENDRALPRPDTQAKLCEIFGKSVESWGVKVQKSVIWNVPYLRNQYFIGREQVLGRLHSAFCAENTVGQVQHRTLSGLGGIGKTQTAVEYAYRYGDEYTAVLWVQADSYKSLVTNFAGLASLLDLPEQEDADQMRIVAAVKRSLQTQKEKPWLLIFDNADALSMVSEFLPTRGSGATLLTTRSQITGKHIKKIEIEKMSRGEGVQFLLHRSGALENGRCDEASEEWQHAQVLYEIMDGLPLALDQAAAYVEEHKCDLSEYLTLYQTQRKVLLQRRGSLNELDYPRSVMTTWSLSIQEVEQASLIAADLLRFCAFLYPDAIPEELLIARVTELEGDESSASNSLLVNDAIGILRRYSLIQRNTGMKTLTIHRLVQAVIQDDMDKQLQRQWTEQTMFLIKAAFPHVEHKNWPQCERLLPHVLLVAQHIERLQIMNEQAGRLFSETSIYLRDRSRYAEAESLLLLTLQILERQLGPEHLDVAMPLNNLASLYLYQGKYEQVESLCKRALQIYEQLGYPNGDAPLHTLATLYISLGKYEQAEPFLLQALQIRKRQLGPEHLDVAASLNNLASLYLYQGKYEQAESVFLQARKIYEWQPEHPNLAYLLNNLAELYLDRGNYAEAESLFLQARRICEQQLGLNHHGMAFPLNGLANLYREQGNYAEAEPLFRQAIQILEQHLKPEHSDIAAPLHGLANLYREQGNYIEAAPLYLRALHILEQVVGRDQPETAKVMYDLARFQEVQGNCGEAEVWYATALAVYEQAFGMNHSKTVEIRKRFTVLIHTMKQNEEAIQLETIQFEQGKDKKKV